jgi:hypothetical protein
MTKKYFYLILIVLFLFLTPSLFAIDIYWEAPEPFSPRQGSFPVSAFSEEFSVVIWQEVTPNRGQNGTGGIINVHLAVKEMDEDWEQRGVVAGPYPYSGAEPTILSIVIDNDGRIVIAAARTSTQIEILISSDRGHTFSSNTINVGAESSVAPRIFVRADGGYLLFVTRGLSQTLSIFYSRSDDGVRWSSFSSFTPESTLALNFVPTHSSIENRDIVFYQSFVTSAEGSSSFQLLYKTSDTGGRTWTERRRFSIFTDPVYTDVAPHYFDNQRPHLSRYGDNLLLVWERRYSTQTPQIYSTVINSNGNIVSPVEKVNTDEAYCNNPIGFLHEDLPTVVWFDNRRGNDRVVLAQRNENGWEVQQLSNIEVPASFARPVTGHDGLYVFWQGTVNNAGRIYIIGPDRSCSSPQITALNFTLSIPSRSERPRVAWDIPYDTSGISGFSWTWSQDEEIEPHKDVMINNTGSTQNLNLELMADEEG